MRRLFRNRTIIGSFKEKSNKKLLSISSLYDEVNKYRKQLAKQRNTTEYELDDELVYDLLIGSCDDNSILFGQHLSTICSNNILRVSGAVDYSNEPTPKSESEARDTGTAHYWLLVEVPSQDPHSYANVDLITESKTISRYEPTVQVEKPEDYIIFKVQNMSDI
jgi:hypothetical protein